jgi:dimethylargininase
MTAVQALNPVSNAIVCPPGRNLASATSIGVPDDARAAAQHQKYVEALKQCGVDVTVMAPETTFPNACFVGNMAVVTEYLAVIGNFSNHNPRQGEQKSIASALAGEKFLKFITQPGLLDADDVLRIGDHFYIGLSEHTNHEGAAQLAFFLREFGYSATVLEQDPENAVRLNTAGVYLDYNCLIIREELSRHFAFLSFDKIVIPRQERGAANALMVNGTLLMPAGYAESAAAVKDVVTNVIEINVSEFEKMGGGLKNLSLCLPKSAKNGTLQLPASLSGKSAAA